MNKKYGTLAGWGALLSGLAACVALLINQININNELNRRNSGSTEPQTPVALPNDAPTPSARASPDAGDTTSSTLEQQLPTTERASELLSRADELDSQIVQLENALGQLEAVEVSVNQNLRELSPGNPTIPRMQALLEEEIYPQKRRIQGLLDIALNERKAIHEELLEMGLI